MIETPLRYQTEGDNWIRRVAIGSGVTLLWFVVFLPVFPLFGYLLEVLRQVLRGETATPPEWDEYDVVQLSRNGVKAFGILFVYGLVVGVITLLPPGVLLLLGLLLGSSLISMVGTLLGSVLSLVGTVVFGIVAPIMLCNFVVHDDLNAGFDMGLLWAFATNRTMLRAIGLAIMFSFGASIASGMLVVTVVGPAVVVFVGLSAVAYVWADGFADAYRELYGALPEIPDGPTKVRVGDGVGATGARADTTGDDEMTTDADTGGPDPSDERWD